MSGPLRIPAATWIFLILGVSALAGLVGWSFGYYAGADSVCDFVCRLDGDHRGSDERGPQDEDPQCVCETTERVGWPLGTNGVALETHCYQHGTCAVLPSAHARELAADMFVASWIGGSREPFSDDEIVAAIRRVQEASRR